MAKNSLPITILILRLLAFAFFIVSIIVLGTNKLTLPDSSVLSGKTTITFKDVYAYRYVLSVGVVGCVYVLLQIPFAAIRVSTGNQLGGSYLMLWMNLFTDTVVALILATGVGAGFGLTVEVKRLFDAVANSVQDLSDYVSIDDSELSDLLSKIDKFLDVVNVSTGFLLLATMCLGLVIVTQTYSLARR